MTEVQRRSTKAEAAVALLLAGSTPSEIADALGYTSGKHAMTAIERVLAEQATVEDKAHMRSVATMRYERLLRAVWAKAINPQDAEQLAAVRSAKDLIERIVALHGLAVPQELVVRTPTQNELEQWVAQVTRVGLPSVEEADVLDVEIVDDDSPETG